MPNENHKNENFEKVHADKKARRREPYRMMQSDKKEALLTRARANKAQTSRRQHAASSLINSSANPSSSMSANSSSEQCAPFMGYSILYETDFIQTAERLNINVITPKTEEWTCKVQVVDKGRPRDNIEKTKYQLMILQDEEENQVECIIFNAEITHFEDLFRPFHTNLVSVAQVKESNYMYGNPVNKFTWTIDRSTIVEPVETINPPEVPLPPPTRLTLTPFDNFEYQHVLAIVLNGSSSTYASNGKRIQDFIIMDDQKKPTKFTLWKDFIDHDGNKLFKQLKEYPVILARKIGRPKSPSGSGLTNRFSTTHTGLTSRFSTTIEINPPYPQANALRTWARENEQMLIAYTIESTSPTGSLLFVPFEEEIVPIADIQQQSPGQIFSIQAEVALQNEKQRFFILACSDCKQHFTRTVSRRTFYCTNCRRSTLLVPRCQFEVTVTDQSGSTTATISDEHAENILLLTSEELYNIYNVKKELPPIVNAQKQLTGKIFNLQMKKLFTKNHDAVPGKLVILSFIPKGNPASQTPSTIKDVAEGSKRKIEHVSTGEQEHPQTTNKGSTSYNKHKVEMKIPVSKRC
ncbi:PREDICTED: replication protein A 70 kDa DNA-binding subunit B-like isoform X2 [Nicotiana attenuata]|nr:PREDICTED: replication protein A 70 kDa DNA-binding subunit B-like isoform X2 [Nicotiana attenuata]